MPTNPIITVFIIWNNRGRIDTDALIAPILFPHLTIGVCTVLQNLIWSVTTQRRYCQQNQSVHLSLLIATEEELISLIYFQIDQWIPCYCAPELYNKSSIIRNINNWNTKTTYINTITFSITIQVKIHQTLTQLHSASHFKSKYIVFRDTIYLKKKRIYSTITITTTNSDILKTKRKIKENIIYSTIPKQNQIQIYSKQNKTKKENKRKHNLFTNIHNSLQC